MMRPHRDSDRSALETFLRQHVARSMFPLGNLFGGGLATVSWVVEGPAGLVGYLGRAENGNLMPQWPNGDWAQAVPFLAGQTVAGLVGPPEQCTDLTAALDLCDRPTIKSEIEPGFSLSLDALVMPDIFGFSLRQVEQGNAKQASNWRAQSHMELLAVDAAEATAMAKAEVSRMVAQRSHWLLMRGPEPVAFAGINAAIPGVVQVGGVFTPPALRGQGLARRAVAMMLDLLRHRGVSRANLFAASENAARAYLAIGFLPSHSFAIHLFAKPEQVACP